MTGGRFKTFLDFCRKVDNFLQLWLMDPSCLFQSDLSRISVQGSTCGISELESTNVLSDLGSIASVDDEEVSQAHPLFLHLTCSLRNKNHAGSDMALLPVRTLPTCLGNMNIYNNILIS